MLIRYVQVLSLTLAQQETQLPGLAQPFHNRVYTAWQNCLQPVSTQWYRRIADCFPDFVSSRFRIAVVEADLLPANNFCGVMLCESSSTNDHQRIM